LLGHLTVLFSVATLLAPFLSVLSMFLFLKQHKKNVYKISIFFSYFALITSFVMLTLFFNNHKHIYIFRDTLFSLYITPLSVMLMAFVSTVSLVIHTYSIKYMYDEEGYIRFFILLDLMIGTIFAITIFSNLLMLALFWHLIGVILYFQLIHNYTKKQSYKFGFYTFFTHLLSDIPLIMAVVLIYKYYNTLDLKLFLDILPHHNINLNMLGTHWSLASIIATLIVLSAIIKSAGFPFHIWLPFTLEGPTPISALMHAGIVNAGAFLTNRFAPIFLQGDSALYLMLIIGFITAIIGSSSMLMQNDIKKALAYSTVGQMGYMMLEVGSGAFALAIYHMMVHGIFKASLFLGSGSIINEARNNPNIADRSIFDFFFSKANHKKPSFIEYALFTMILPMVITFYIFFSNSKTNLLESGILFYLFAWVSGAQTIYTMYKTHKRFKAIFLTFFGFGISLCVYLAMEHFFGTILFFDRELPKKLLEAASWNKIDFYIIYGVITCIILATWIFKYQDLVYHKSIYLKFRSIYAFVYKIFSREFYILDISSNIAKKMIAFSKSINMKLRY